MDAHIALPQDEIAVFCQRWNVAELALFGSILRDDFKPDSDIDVLISFGPDTHPSLEDLLEMENELREIMGREVDLGERRSVEEDPNYIRRNHILRSAQVIYAQG